VGVGRVLVAAFAVTLGGGRVLLRLLVLAEFVVVSRFEVVVGGGLVARGGLVVVIRRRMPLLVSHVYCSCRRSSGCGEIRIRS
jgi:hypothetical protein